MSDAGATRGPKKEASPSEALLVSGLDATRKTGAFGDVRWDLAGGLLAGLLEAVSKALGGRFGASFWLLGGLLERLGGLLGPPGGFLGRKAGFFGAWSPRERAMMIYVRRASAPPTIRAPPP